MKYGAYLKANISPEYGEAAYLNYAELNDIIRDLSQSAPSG
jgi:SPX domain protein involved in polyphosphate accumulation